MSHCQAKMHQIRFLASVRLSLCGLFVCPFVSYGVAQKVDTFFVRLNSSNTDRFSNLFYCYNREKICINAITKYRTTFHVCR